MKRIITLRYPATCADCGASLEAGDPARYYGRGRVYGTECHEKPATARDVEMADPPTDFERELMAEAEWERRNGM